MQPDSARPWVVASPTAGAIAIRLFCFPPAGSGVAVYRTWAPMLGHGVQLCSILPPGREIRFGEEPIADFGEMVTAASAAIQPWAGEPYALFGHSLGSLVAYEVARRLTALDLQPAHLFVSGHDSPGQASRRAPIAHLPEQEFLQGLIALGGTSPEIAEARELLALLLPMLRADFTLAESYHPLPGPRLSCAVTALCGEADPWVDSAGLAAWRAVTTGIFESAVLPGDHFYLMPSGQQIVAQINSRIAARAAAA